MRTLLPKKSNQGPIAADDETLAQLIRDPSIPQFPQNTSLENYYVQNQGNQQYVPQQQLLLTGAADTTAANNADVLVSNDNTDWINRKWRPMLSWVYMITCIMDFIIFPILWSMLQTIYQGQVTNQWQPVTLMGAGLYHIAMGACLGIAVYGRTREKLADKQ